MRSRIAGEPRERAGVAGQHVAGSTLGIENVRLQPVAGAITPRSLHLHDSLAPFGQVTREAGAVRASAEGQHTWLATVLAPDGLEQALGRCRFDAIVDLAAFHPREVREVVELLGFSPSLRVRFKGAVYQRGP